MFWLDHSQNYISIHPPRVGRDRETASVAGRGPYFNPPSPCGEGPNNVSIRAESAHFNPPSPCGEGRGNKCKHYRRHPISIHPPRVGRDSWGRSTMARLPNFNPPSPCGEGRRCPAKRLGIRRFQSTLPVWGGTPAVDLAIGGDDISIHPPRVGRDFREFPQVKVCIVFQSTLPVWGGTACSLSLYIVLIFQSTLPVWGGTAGRSPLHGPFLHFNPPSPCGEGRSRC